MPAILFQLVLPVYALMAVLTLATNRVRVRRATGTDPVVLRPFGSGGSPHTFLEGLLIVGGALLVIDVSINAVARPMVLRRIGVPLVATSEAVGWVGFLLLNGGLLVSRVAIRQMGNSWRIGIDATTPGALVTGGLYARIRHPIYSGLLLVVTGIALTLGDVIAIGVACAGWACIPVQARLEEEFLVDRYGDAYRTHLERTHRFWPGLRAPPGRLRG